MKDREPIEHLLHVMAGDVRVGTHMSPQVRRRIMLRRITTAGVGLTVVAALGLGSAYAVSALGLDRSSVGPANQDSNNAVTQLFADFGNGEYFEVEVDPGAGTICYSRTGLKDRNVVMIEIVEDFEKRIHIPTKLVGYGEKIAGVDGCRELVNKSDARRMIDLPHRFFLLINRHNFGEQIAALTREPFEEPDTRCGPPVDFEPTYVPDGWVKALQPAEGGGGEFRGIVGHYGNDAQPGTVEKARGGFADLIANERPYQQDNVEQIRVLDEPATLGDIHEGYSVEFTHNGCDYFLLAFGVTRDELHRFSEGFRLSDEAASEPIDEEGFAALWPEDTAAEAEDRCRRHSGAPQVWSAHRVTTAGRFSEDVLRWEQPLIHYTSTEKEFQKMEIRRSENDDGPRARGPAVFVYLTEVVPDCWSVVSVSRVPDRQPTGVSISIRRRDVEIGFDHLGADSIYFEIGHGYYTNSSYPEPPDGRITALLSYPLGDTGHFLLLFKDEDGEVFSATGGPLPAGDLTAG